MESIESSPDRGDAGAVMSISHRRCNELENVVKQLQADIDTLREFSEVEREFMEMQVLQERAKNDDLAKRLEFTGKRGANVEKWSEQLKSKQAAEGLEFYRNMMLDSFQNQSADYNFSNSLKKTTPCLRAEHYNKAAAELLVIGL